MGDIDNTIKKIYKEVEKKIFSNRQNKKAIKVQNNSQIKGYIISLQNSFDYEKFCKKYAIILSKKIINKNRSKLLKQYNLAKSKKLISLPYNFNEFEKKQLEEIEKQNFLMIKSVPEKILKTYQQKDIQNLIGAVAEGKRSRSYFENQLQFHGYKNAKLIARTETAKMQTAIDKLAAQDLGSVIYEWRSNNDRRTRPSHKEMDGVLVFWRDNENEKPLRDKMRGDAGEFPNCRCTTLAIVDPDRLNLSYYKVYNYHTDKIETVKKSVLLNWIIEGEISE